jgi:hypothetical protein
MSAKFAQIFCLQSSRHPHRMARARIRARSRPELPGRARLQGSVVCYSSAANWLSCSSYAVAKFGIDFDSCREQICAVQGRNPSESSEEEGTEEGMGL